MSSDRPIRNFYGRIRGKALKDSQRRYLAEDLPCLSLPGVDWQENPDRRPLDLGALLGDRPVWLEIGFGSGEHLVHQARLHPEVGLIGAEPYLNGVASLLGKLRRDPCRNVALHAGDARDLMDVLPRGAIARAFLLYPDPWPKARHHRRRFVTPDHLGPLATAMAPGAELRLATDIPDYVRQALEEVPRAGFDWVAGRAADWRRPWPGWTPTRYEAKAAPRGACAALPDLRAAGLRQRCPIRWVWVFSRQRRRRRDRCWTVAPGRPKAGARGTERHIRWHPTATRSP